MNIPTSIYRHGLFLTGRLVNRIWPENLANRVRFPAALLLGSIMLGQTVAAQTAPLQLTLKDSIALALKQNIDVQVANRRPAEKHRSISIR